MSSIEPIVVSLETPASPDAAWRYLSEPELIERWFTTTSRAERVGAPYRIDFGDGSVVAGVVRALEPGRRLAYSWAWEGAEPRQETLVGWTVEALPGGGSRVTLVHDGWSEAGADEAARDDHAGYWEAYVDDLRALLAEEAGGSR